MTEKLANPNNTGKLPKYFLPKKYPYAPGLHHFSEESRVNFLNFALRTLRPVEFLCYFVFLRKSRERVRVAVRVYQPNKPSNHNISFDLHGAFDSAGWSLNGA